MPNKGCLLKGGTLHNVSDSALLRRLFVVEIQIIGLDRLCAYYASSDCPLLMPGDRLLLIPIDVNHLKAPILGIERINLGG